MPRVARSIASGHPSADAQSRSDRSTAALLRSSSSSRTRPAARESSAAIPPVPQFVKLPSIGSHHGHISLASSDSDVLSYKISYLNLLHTTPTPASSSPSFLLPGPAQHSFGVLPVWCHFIDSDIIGCGFSVFQ